LLLKELNSTAHGADANHEAITPAAVSSADKDAKP
jgi:hypothetical protein